MFDPAGPVLGIDPGLSRCGYGIVAREPGSARALGCGVIRTPAGDPLPERLLALDTELRALIADTRPSAVAVERVLFQSNARTAMSVGQASGVVLAEAASAGCEVAEYSPNEVKETVTGWGAAPKEQVERMVRSLLGIEQRLRPVDAADALALALCHLARVRGGGGLRMTLGSTGRQTTTGAQRTSTGAPRTSTGQTTTGAPR